MYFDDFNMSIGPIKKILRAVEVGESITNGDNHRARVQCMPIAGGGPCDETLKKIGKSRFCKSYDTLTTIQLGEKTQLTKVVSPLKRFGDPLQAR